MGKQLPRVAVLIPCYNEEIANRCPPFAGFAARSLRRGIYVYDNNSKDRTMEAAREAGAIVRQETLQGKGNVVRRMFSDVDADVYIMTDGDATYDPGAAQGMIDLLIKENLDMVVGRRISTETAAYRAGHVLGNRMLTGFLAQLFGQRFTDILSGYRVFSRRFAKSFPALSAGFETETELTVHALTLNLPIAENRDAIFRAPRGLRQQAEHLPRWLPDLAGHASAVQERTAGIVFRDLCSRPGAALDRAVRAGSHHLPRDRLGATFPDGDLIGNDHDARLPERRLWFGARHRDPRTPRDEALGLPANPSTTRRPEQRRREHRTDNAQVALLVFLGCRVTKSELPADVEAAAQTRLKGMLSKRETQRFLKFLVVGGVGFCVDTGTLSLLVLCFSVDRVVAKGVAFALAVLNNFVWNRLWTYPEARSKSLLTQVSMFVAVSCVGLGIALAVFNFVDGLALQHVNEVIALYTAQAASVGVALFWNYAANRFITYSDVAIGI